MHFISLHSHTSFSSGDGHGTPEQHVQRVKELGMTALALTEHGTVSSHVQLEKACIKHGVKPIFGVEAYVAPPGEKRKFHQTVLAMNTEGYLNLNRLVTKSWKQGEGFYYKPTIHPDDLLDPAQTQGLIVLSGCADSWLSCTIAGGKSLGPRLGEDSEDLFTPDEDDRLQAAATLIERFVECYGDRFYLEIQPFDNYPRTCYLNQHIVQLSAELDVPIVGTADVHYPYPEDWEIQKLSNSIAWNVPFHNMDRDYSAGLCAYPSSDAEIIRRYVNTGVSKDLAVEAVKNTVRIANRCNVTLPKTELLRAPENVDKTPEQASVLLKQAVKDGWAWRLKHDKTFRTHAMQHKQAYVERLKKELEVIEGKDFADYFLINAELIGWAKQQGIVVGPGRGSAAGSLVCYLSRITEINPMLYPEMLFERFLDPGREDYPDIDTDYQDDRRDEIMAHTRTMYGPNNVANIGNYARFRGKTAIKAAGKALGVPRWELEEFADHITDAPFGDPREFNTAEDAAMSFDEPKRILQDYPELELAFRLEGDQRTLGVHAAGLVISNTPIEQTCALYDRTKSNSTDTILIAYDKRDAAYLNMVKLDCLGLKTMTIIADTLQHIGGDLTLNDLYTLPLDDEQTLAGFADNKTSGVFQFEGRSTRAILKRIFPNGSTGARVPDFRTLADINALSRPGALLSGMTDLYIEVEHGAPVPTIHPVVDAILADSNGCLIYQEQVMRIGKEFGGLTDHEIGRLRKIIGAKQSGGAFDEFWGKFRDGAKTLHGVDEAQARGVWDYMAASASYLFNVAHAISYTLIGYWCMYLKTYYPQAFYAACLKSVAKRGTVKGKSDAEITMLIEVTEEGLEVYPPILGVSGVSWAPYNKGVVAGYSQIPGVGEKTATLIQQAVATHGFTQWEDLSGAVKGMGEKTLHRITEWVAQRDPFGIYHSNMLVSAVTMEIRAGELPLAEPWFTVRDMPSQGEISVIFAGVLVYVQEIDVVAQAQKYDGKTPEEILATLKHPELVTKAKLVCVDRHNHEIHVNVNRFLYPRLKPHLMGLDMDNRGYVVHVTGVANNNFGPAIQAEDVNIIEVNEF